MFDPADLQVLLDPSSSRYQTSFDHTTRLEHLRSECNLPGEFVFEDSVSSSSQVTRSVLSRLKKLWQASGKHLAGQGEKEETTRRREASIGCLLHNFDRIWTVYGGPCLPHLPGLAKFPRQSRTEPCLNELKG